MNYQSNDTFTNFLFAESPLSALAFFIWGIFTLITIAYIIRLWLVQTATFKIRRDLEEIKNYLVTDSEDDINETENKAANTQSSQRNFTKQSINLPVKLVGKPGKLFYILLGTVLLIFLVLMAIILIINK